jgi:formylglycine-generating enzyme required for sulfatase activity
VLRRWGGRYAELAEELEQGVGRLGVEEGADEAIEFPPLKVLDFVTARLVESVAEAEFPAIETETFTVTTIEFETADPIFKFEVRTVYQQGGWWAFQNESRDAFGFVESLNFKKNTLISRVVERLSPNPSQDISLEMVSIPGDTFLMGSPLTESKRSSSESPQHRVIIAPFFMGRHPITYAQWRIVCETMPQVKRKLIWQKLSRNRADKFNEYDLPIEKVSWDAAVEFCARLSRYTGREYRLPSEAEWEYACRAGTTTPFHFGETIMPELANYNHIYSYNDGPKGKSPAGKTTGVGQFVYANAFGLSNMHGNVWEWCSDDWHSHYDRATVDGDAWLSQNAEQASRKVIRGGSWNDPPLYCRSAYRNFSVESSSYIGFRVVCSVPRIPS